MSLLKKIDNSFNTLANIVFVILGLLLAILIIRMDREFKKNLIKEAITESNQGR